MGELSRIGVAIDSDLLEKFDSLIAARGYTNRSEAFRDMIREELVDAASEDPEGEVVGSVTLVYVDDVMRHFVGESPRPHAQRQVDRHAA